MVCTRPGVMCVPVFERDLMSASSQPDLALRLDVGFGADQRGQCLGLAPGGGIVQRRVPVLARRVVASATVRVLTRAARFTSSRA